MEKSYLFVSDTPSPADFIICFGNGDPQRMQRRVKKAVELMQSGFSNCILFSGDGGKRKGACNPLEPESQQMKKIAINLGATEENLFTEEESNTTVQNAECVRRWREQTQLFPTTGTLLLVSCPFHMRRLSLLMAKELPEAKLLCCPPQSPRESVQVLSKEMKYVSNIAGK